MLSNKCNICVLFRYIHCAPTLHLVVCNAINDKQKKNKTETSIIREYNGNDYQILIFINMHKRLLITITITNIYFYT